MSSKHQKSKPKQRKNKKKSSNKQKLSHLLGNTNNNNSNSHNINNNYQKSCNRGDSSFNIEEWLASYSNQGTPKLSEQMLPTRAAAIKAKNGLSNQSGLGSGIYDTQKEKDPRQVVNENRILYEEYGRPFTCIQLFNIANVEVLDYKTHTIANDQEQQ